MSTIRIIKNPAIDLNLPKFSIDENSVGEHLNHHPLLKLLNVYGFLCVIGRPRQGKTSLTVSMLTQKKPKIYRKTYNYLYIFMPSNSINSMKDDPFETVKKDQIYDELNDETINDVYAKLNENSEINAKSMVYIDDQTASLKGSKFIQETLKKIIYNRRHLKTNIIITAQSYVNIPLDVRKNIENLILFKPAKKEFEIVFQELFEMKRDDALQLMKDVYQSPHDFLFLNVPSQRLFCNWDELKLTSEDTDDEIEFKK
jgi:hypothetical protein